MGHNSVVLGHSKSTGVSRVHGLSMGPPDLGRHSLVSSHSERKSDFGVISSHSLLLNDQTSWVKEIQKDFKVRNKH